MIWSPLVAFQMKPACSGQGFSDTSLPFSDPQFVKATTLRHEEPHQDKIYYFFREDNPDKSPEAPRNISRVAQLCKVPWELSMVERQERHKGGKWMCQFTWCYWHMIWPLWLN